MSRNETKSQKMWGGRFAAQPDEIMQAINASIDVDQRMAAEDIAGSKAHAKMLAAQGILTETDHQAIQEGLTQIEAEIEAGRFPFSRALEDIHMNIEARLKDLIGEAAGRLHTARSRNDQVVTDFRLWCRTALSNACDHLEAVQEALLGQAEAHISTLMPGFTHLQTAQPITLGHHLLAYIEMLARDRERFGDAAIRLNECPLGAGALAGTGFDIDRHMTAEALGFDHPMANSLDAVASRDFALECLAALSISATHLSRLAEEIVLWTSAQFDFARLSDAWSTGSSIMPQKRNPDAAELVRAKAGLMTASFMALQSAVKALPLAYAKDLQDDKRLTFEAFDSFALCARAMAGMIETIEFHPETMAKAAARGYSTATDLADYLVRELGMPFREAHHITGRIVALADEKTLELADLDLNEMQTLCPQLTDHVYSVLTIDASAASRTSYGGTAPIRVAEQVEAWKTRLMQDRFTDPSGETDET